MGSNTVAFCTIDVLHSLLCPTAAPDIHVSSGGGPQFTSKELESVS